jgi:hypothetical protein
VAFSSLQSNLTDWAVFSKDIIHLLRGYFEW